MNDVELNLYNKLQPLFAEKMGPIKGDDFIYLPERPSSGIMTYRNFRNEDALMYYKYIRLPHPIDPFQPERGLVGMIKEFESLIGSKNGDYFLVYTETNVKAFEGATPTEALLRAIIAQEEMSDQEKQATAQEVMAGLRGE